MQGNILSLNLSSKLYDILWRVLDNLYCQNYPQTQPLDLSDTLPLIAGCEHELDDWVSALPHPFRLGNTEPGKDILEETNFDYEISINLVKLLHLRYYGLRLLIHRPILEQHLSDTKSFLALGSETSNGVGFVAGCCQHSLDTISTASIKIISVADSFEGTLVPGMWWTSLYFGKTIGAATLTLKYADKTWPVFNAAVTCFAIILIQARGPTLEQRQSIKMTNLQNSIRLAFSALQKLAPGHQAIHRATDFLRHILELSEILSGCSGNLCGRED